MSTLKVDNIRHNSATSDAITMASDGTCTARITGMTGGGQLSHRNVFINGAMQVNQRVQTGSLGYFNPVTSSIYTLDRWKVSLGGGFDTDSAKIYHSTTAPTSEGFTKSLKVDIGNTETPSSGQRANIGQRIEGQNLQHLCYGTSSAKTMTLTFWVYSNKTGTYSVQIVQENKKYVLYDYTISSSNTWEKKTITIVGNTADTIDNDNGVGFYVDWFLCGHSDVSASPTSSWTSGSSYRASTNQVNLWDNANNYWYLTGCQLEVGDTATSFEHLSLAEDKRRCYRYCQRGRHVSSCLVGTPGTYYFSRGNINLFTPMRATVTGTLKAATWNSNRYFQYMTWSSGTNVTAAPASTTFSSGSITGVPDILSVVLHISISSGSSNSPLPANGPGSNNVYPIEYFDVLLEAEL